MLGPRSREVVAAARLHRARERRAERRTLLEGPHLLEAALEAGVRPEKVYALVDDEATAGLAIAHDLRMVRVDPSALSRLAGTKTPRGPVAVVAIPPPSSVGGDRHVLVAWGVGDPGNLGTLIRTAASFDWEVAATPGTADPWAPKVLRSAAGAHFATTVGEVSSLDALAKVGLRTVASVVRGGIPPDRLGEGRFAVLIGEEAAGLPEDVVNAADHKVTIPMPGPVESLNAAAAAAILVYELSKPGGNRVSGV